MKINLCTDAPKHNLALMKISAWHKAQGDQVWLNGVGQFDKSYGSWLFDFSEKSPCDVEGGTGIDPTKKLDGFNEFPDYSLFGINYSVGYTWRFCPRRCPFCIVPLQRNTLHHGSIWDFHPLNFTNITLLNNNTFSDPQWKETFEEIWDAGLTVIDENGYDLRLIDDEKANALRRTKFRGYIHYAWDLMDDEKQIREGLAIAPRGMVYVLIGFNTTEEEDLHRCQVINDSGFDPYIMPYGKTVQGRKFKRFIDSRMYRKYKSISDAWKDYKPIHK